MEKKRFYSFCWNLSSEEGHFYVYHDAVSRAAKKNQWISIKFLLKNASLWLGRDWKKVLPPSQGFWNQIKNTKILFWLFRRMKKRRKEYIFFAEYFSISSYALLFFAVFFWRPSGCHIWVLERYEKRLLMCRGVFHKILFSLFQKMLKKRFQLFADTEELAKNHQEQMNVPVVVFPIPHTRKPVETEKNRETVVCLYPGNSLREERGLSTIYDLSKRIKNSSFPIAISLSEKFKIYLDQKNLNVSGGLLNWSLQWNRNQVQIQEHLLFFSKKLSNEQYEQELNHSDLVLFPYQVKRYRYRSSGPFVEAVYAEKIPLVSDETWMAKELRKFELHDLILDWDQKNILERFLEISRDKKIRRNIASMAKQYREVHSVENFAKVMQETFDQNSF